MKLCSRLSDRWAHGLALIAVKLVMDLKSNDSQTESGKERRGEKKRKGRYLIWKK